MALDKVLYRTRAKATGGRDGRDVVPESNLELKLTTPKDLGGPGGEGTNPEQLFAAGYSACFLSALKLVAGKQKIALAPETTVEGIVGLGPIPNGFGIEVELVVYLPGVPVEVAHKLVEATHQVCPYSNATRNNVDVKLTLA